MSVASLLYYMILPLSLRRAALKLWKQRRGSGATYNGLIEVFERAGYKNLADIVRSIAGNHIILVSESCMINFMYIIFYIYRR